MKEKIHEKSSLESSVLAFTSKEISLQVNCDKFKHKSALLIKFYVFLTTQNPFGESKSFFLLIYSRSTSHFLGFLSFIKPVKMFEGITYMLHVEFESLKPLKISVKTFPH